jgi:hypothetical protein
MTAEQVADATAELIARIALLLERRNALSVAEFLPIVEALTAANENPALPAMADRVSERLRGIEAARNRRSARGVLDARDAAQLPAAPWQSHNP